MVADRLRRVAESKVAVGPELPRLTSRRPGASTRAAAEAGTPRSRSRTTSTARQRRRQAAARGTARRRRRHGGTTASAPAARARACAPDDREQGMNPEIPETKVLDNPYTYTEYRSALTHGG